MQQCIVVRTSFGQNCRNPLEVPPGVLSLPPPPITFSAWEHAFSVVAAGKHAFVAKKIDPPLLYIYRAPGSSFFRKKTIPSTGPRRRRYGRGCYLSVVSRRPAKNDKPDSPRECTGVAAQSGISWFGRSHLRQCPPPGEREPAMFAQQSVCPNQARSCPDGGRTTVVWFTHRGTPLTSYTVFVHK